MDDSRELNITDGRHPVLDRLLSSDQFVPNDTRLGVEGVEVIVLTGPNMAGKSTYIRQVALLVPHGPGGLLRPGQGNEGWASWTASFPGWGPPTP